MSAPYHYRRWDGTQDPFRSRVDIRDVLDELSHDILQGFGSRSALRDLLRRGPRGQRGLEDIRADLMRRRQRLERDLDAAGPLREMMNRLDDIVDEERSALADNPSDDARLKEMDLDTLPGDLGKRITQLQRHDWESGPAQAKFEQLVSELRKEMLDSWFRDLSQGMESVTPEDIARVTSMLNELNEMLDKRERGEDYDFDGFMERYGDMFPDDPQTLDELLQSMRSRMAAMARLLAQMTPEQRQELMSLNQALLDDMDLQFELSRLQQHLGPMDLPPMMPGEEGQAMPGAPSLAQAVGQMERLNALDELERQLAGDYPGASLTDIDLDRLRNELGDEAAADVEALKEIERALEESDAVRTRDGELELTPKGARLLGEKALTSLLDRIQKEPSSRTVGADPEPTGQTRAWRFGDREPISVERSIANAVTRQGPTGPSGRVHLTPDDFEVLETEVRPRTATALLLDLSFSMPLQGHFVPAKRMALALHALIEGKHRQDSLHLIGFSDYARRLQPADLGAPGFERVYGTNMEHAFLLARRVLSEDPRPVKQVIMVTDGEPTAHLEGGQSVFNWPPVPETLQRTLQEAKRLARLGAALHIFLLEDAPGLVAFADRLSALTGGTVLQMQGDELGRRILQDYLAGPSWR